MDQTDSAAGTEFPAENLAEGIAVVDAEAEIGAGSEATRVLVEGKVEDGGYGIGGCIGGSGNWGGGGWFFGIERH